MAKTIVGPEDAVGASSTAPAKETSAAPVQPVKVYTFVCALDTQPGIVPGLFGPVLLWPGIEYTTTDPVVADKLRRVEILKER